MSAPPGTSTDAVVEALERAGLLLGRGEDLPSFVSTITDDSRQAGRGALFVAVRGTARDGHEYLTAARGQGAAAAIVEDEERARQAGIPALVVREGRRAAAVAAAAFYGEPARRLRLIGVTGTNGKTTTVSILRHLLDEPEARAASIGTLGVLLGSAGEEVPGGGGLTTPGPVELQRLLRQLADAGARSVAMEVSSHSLDQRRVEGILYDAGVFTNLTRDHLDYHGTFEAYFAAKALLVDHLKPDGAAVINADDPAWAQLGRLRRLVSFGIHAEGADYRATDVAFTPRGSEFTLALDAPRRVRVPLIGDFNVANALGAAVAAFVVGERAETIVERLATIPQVAGRLELINEAPTVLRDYAHTPDALERALQAVRPFTPGRLIVVFGAGGDRDRGKRPEMGAVAESRADVVIVTSDNPRTEDPERILDDIVAGMVRQKHERIEDRHAAIARALQMAREGDVVVLAGKGHETYQIRGTTKHPFDEREIVRELTGR